MTDRLDKGKTGRGKSLSRGKKKGGVNSGRTAGTASNTTPITTFFSSQPPPKLACPLCGHFVPRFKINEHIDVECQNFERSDSGAPSARSELSPTRSPLKSPTSGTNEEKQETKTSPYFKKNSPRQQVPQNVCHKNVVRKLDLGSLSAKLLRKSEILSSEKKETERQPAHTEKEMNSEIISNSQKENQLILEAEKDSSQVADLTLNSKNLSNAAVDVLYPEAKHGLDHKTNSQPMNIPAEVNSSSSKLTKRKHGAFNESKLSFSKKTKHVEEEDGQSAATVETPLGERKEAETGHIKSAGPSCPATNPSGKTAAENKSASLSEVGAGDQAVDGAQLLRLPYYLRNFRTVLHAVLENEDDRRLFDQQDMSYVHAFERLSGNANATDVLF